MEETPAVSIQAAWIKTFKTGRGDRHGARTSVHGDRADLAIGSAAEGTGSEASEEEEDSVAAGSEASAGNRWFKEEWI